MITKLIISLHRYLGVVLSLLVLMWSISGIFMIYVDFPDYSSKEKRAASQPVKFNDCKISPKNAADKSDLTAPFHKIRLRMMGDTPVYRFNDLKGNTAVVNAVTGNKINDVSKERALKYVSNYFDEMELDKNELYVIEMKNRDQWTPLQNYKKHLPLYKISLKDNAGTVVYVSSQTGEIVQKLTAKERVLAWLGPIPHWTYFTFLRTKKELWTQTVIWISSIAALMCLFGIVTGILRARFDQKLNLPRSLYKKQWFKWHHYLGFIFGIFLFSWTLSGSISLDPLSYHTPTVLNYDEQTEYKKG
ncbi:MAG: PepSY domain-containing protein, partial [Flavobacteriales bacterium]